MSWLLVKFYPFLLNKILWHLHSRRTAASSGLGLTGTLRFYALANETLLLQHPSAAG